MAAHLLDAPLAPLPSSLPDLRDVPLGQLHKADPEALRAVLGRVLPTGDAKAVPVSAFNSSIMIVLAAMLLLRRRP
jgi:FXSXX-COOH protein